MLPSLQPNTRYFYQEGINDNPAQQKAYAFMLSSNVQDSYSAYRLNSNMGIAPYTKPKPIHERQGFFGEKPDLEGSRENRRWHTISLPRLPQAVNVPQFQGYNSPFAGPSLAPQFFPHTAAQPMLYDNQYGINQDRPISFQAPLLMPLPPAPVVMAALFPNDVDKDRRKKQKEQTLEFYEKLIVNQNQNLKKVAKHLSRNYAGAFDTRTIKTKARRLKPNNLNEDTPPDISILSDRSVLKKQNSRKSKSPTASPGPVLDSINSPGSPGTASTGSPQTSPTLLNKQLKKLAKAQRPLNLYKILWALVYHSLLRKDADERVAERKKKVEQGSLKKTQEQKNQLMEFINKHCMPQLQEIYKLKKVLVIVNEGKPKEKPVALKDRQKSFAVIIGKLTAIIETLNGVITLQTFPKSVIEFFEGITRELAVIPPKLLTEFEISRLEVSQYGTLKNVNDMRCKMLLALFLLVRVLIYTSLVSPWVATDQVKESDVLVKNLKNCSSVLYHIIMDYFKENLEAGADVQKDVPPEKRIVPIKNPLLVFSIHNAHVPKPTEEEASHEVLFGLYSREVLGEYLDAPQEGVNKLKDVLAECFEKLYFLVPKGRE